MIGKCRSATGFLDESRFATFGWFAIAQAQHCQGLFFLGGRLEFRISAR